MTVVGDLDWKKAKIASNKQKIKKLADKIVFLSNQLSRWKPRKINTLPKVINNWRKMAKISLICTRKKIYKLQEEIKKLS